MAKCPVCGRESFTIQVRLIDKVPDKNIKQPTGENDRKFEEKLMCDSCYDEYQFR